MMDKREKKLVSDIRKYEGAVSKMWKKDMDRLMKTVADLDDDYKTDNLYDAMVGISYVLEAASDALYRIANGIEDDGMESDRFIRMVDDSVDEFVGIWRKAV